MNGFNNCMTDRFILIGVVFIGALLLGGCLGEGKTGPSNTIEGAGGESDGLDVNTIIKNFTLTVSHTNAAGRSTSIGPFLSGPNCLVIEERGSAGLTNISIEAEFIQASSATTVTEWTLKYFVQAASDRKEVRGPAPLHLVVEAGHVQAAPSDEMYISITPYSSTVGVAHEAEFTVSVELTGSDPSRAELSTGPTCS
jgi:hypothetical protein